MKKSVALILGIFASSISFSQTRHIGNDDTSKFDSEGGTQIENYLLGTKYTLKKAGELTSINLIGKGTGSKVKMAVYKDSNNAPGDLVTSTEAIIIKNGVNSISVDSKSLSEGDYWIMAVYNGTGNHTYTNLDIENKDVYYTSLDFKNNIPTDASYFKKSDRGSDLAYFLEIDGKATSTSTKSNTSLRVFPNPASNYVSIVNKENSISKIEIKDFSGHTVKTVSANSVDKVKVNIKTLPKGIYFVIVNENAPMQIIIK